MMTRLRVRMEEEGVEEERRLRRKRKKRKRSRRWSRREVGDGGVGNHRGRIYSTSMRETEGDGRRGGGRGGGGRGGGGETRDWQK